MIERDVVVYPDPESDAWLAELVDDARCHTFGRTRAEAVGHAHEAVALWLDVDESEVAIRVVSAQRPQPEPA